MPSKSKDNKSGKVISEEEFMKALNALYGKALYGIPKVSRPLIAKCTTSGFLTSLGRLITLPVAILAN